jgi:hypothetical protein
MPQLNPVQVHDIDMERIDMAFWGGRHPDQLNAAAGVSGWSLDDASRATIDRILAQTITDPIGPEFMAPLQRSRHHEEMPA